MSLSAGLSPSLIARDVSNSNVAWPSVLPRGGISLFATERVAFFLRTFKTARMSTKIDDDLLSSTQYLGRSA